MEIDFWARHCKREIKRLRIIALNSQKKKIDNKQRIKFVRNTNIYEPIYTSNVRDLNIYIYIYIYIYVCVCVCVCVFGFIYMRNYRYI